MTHLDLFSGIGGFALAAQTVWGSDYHCVGFCEIDPFCRQVLRKNFEGVRIYGDIRGLTAERLAADTASVRCDSEFNQGEGVQPRNVPRREIGTSTQSQIDLLTGGFPCQPFSTAGKRKGTEDDRFLWPEMLRVIREVKPRWVLGENVAGIIEMALGQVCSDLESLDYEVQCFVIPACAVNAPHRRDRVWIVAHSKSEHGKRAESVGDRCRQSEVSAGNGDCPSSDTTDLLCDGGNGDERECEQCQEVPQSGNSGGETASSDTCGEGLEGSEDARDIEGSRETSKQRPGEFPESRTFPDWSRDWREVAFESCLRGVDDGLPKRLAVLPNGERISESKWRQEALKCYGNSIVPQVAMEIMRAIKAVDAAEVADDLEEAA